MDLAIIPARSGSKGIKDKNIKMLDDKPLMAYSIEAAIDSNCFDKIIVSTDSINYKRLAEKYGAEVPFLRSDKLSTDSASTWDVVNEVLEEYNKLGYYFDRFCVLQPTSPLRTSNDIIEAFRLYDEKKAIAVVSVSELDHPSRWTNVLPEDCSLENFIKIENILPRQSHAIEYRINGAIYVVSVLEFKKNSFFYRKGSYAYIMPRDRSVDIDSEFDFRFAEFLINNKQISNQHY